MTNIGLIFVFVCCCQDTAVFEVDEVSADLREVATSDFLTFAVDKYHDDSFLARYWIGHIQREIRQINGKRRPDLVQIDPDVVTRLEESMAPIRKLERELSRLQGDDYRKMVEQLIAAYSDPAIANATFEILGRDHAVFMIKEHGVDAMTSIERNSVSDWSSFATIVRNPNFISFLNLSDSQIERIQDELSDSISRLAEDLNPFLRQMGRIWHDRWDELLDAMDAGQRSMAIELLGKPVDWFRIPKTGKLEVDRETWVSCYLTYCGTRMGKALKDKEISQHTKQELDDAGIELFNSVAYEMLFATPLWDEYELVDDQRRKLTTEIRNDLNANALVLPENPERIDSLLNQKAEYPETITSFFLPKQLEWFRQIELQILLGRKYDSSVGLLNPKMSKFLDLDETQKTEIKRISDEFEKETKVVAQQMVAMREKAQSEFRLNLMEILTNEQVARLEASTGKRLGFSNEQPTRSK